MVVIGFRRLDSVCQDRDATRDVRRTRRFPAGNPSLDCPPTALINQWYLYIRDCDLDAFFLKCSRYFPCHAKVCLNGHECLKAQLCKAGLPFKG